MGSGALLLESPVTCVHQQAGANKYLVESLDLSLWYFTGGTLKPRGAFLACCGVAGAVGQSGPHRGADWLFSQCRTMDGNGVSSVSPVWTHTAQAGRTHVKQGGVSPKFGTATALLRDSTNLGGCILWGS